MANFQNKMHHPNARRLLYMYRLHIYICIHSTSINTRQSRKQKCRKVCDHIKSKWQWFSAGGWVVLQGKDPSCSGYRQLVEMQDQEAQTVRARKAVLGCSWHLWSAGEGSRRHLLIFNGGGGLDDKTRTFNLISYWARITNYVRKKKSHLLFC